MPRRFEISEHFGKKFLNIDNLLYTEEDIRKAVDHQSNPNNINGYTNDGGEDKMLGRLNLVEGQIRSLWANVRRLQGADERE